VGTKTGMSTGRTVSELVIAAARGGGVTFINLGRAGLAVSPH